MEFTATVELGGKTATGIEIPESIVTALGSGKRPAVTITINGFSYRTTLGSMGGRCMAPLSAENRSGAGVAAGDEVLVGIGLDTAPRTVEVPADLAAALKEAKGATEAFEKLAPSHKKAHVTSVLDAKTDETRQRRIAKVVEKVTGG